MYSPMDGMLVHRIPYRVTIMMTLVIISLIYVLFTCFRASLILAGLGFSTKMQNQQTR